MIEQYINTSNRKFYRLIYIQNNFPDWKNELNELFKANKIRKRNGLNGVIIEVL